MKSALPALLILAHGNQVCKWECPPNLNQQPRSTQHVCGSRLIILPSLLAPCHEAPMYARGYRGTGSDALRALCVFAWMEEDSVALKLSVESTELVKPSGVASRRIQEPEGLSEAALASMIADTWERASG
ncbi:hypothetical protein P153DRAFT_383371 [Dothidotthia symphoricarpi CBS 119687]|uniref:Uncharacterized protein n=1 Tax=Dothidotthia symphoricarpi CBS 119687 TaxID=1392245 RepID=A0A6A6AH38_9PLEO|nr:uncharacterized protein P153DRAFT_383371 [Dothidotthia symphoricarpi CBS 119687]KAF2131259.1 hypothetical protein P153DRAFT_383371 [Dothidotthia symphoricarpi CBS 119687]